MRAPIDAGATRDELLPAVSGAPNDEPLVSQQLVVVQEAAPRVVDALLAERWLSVCPTLQPLQRDTDGGADDVVNLDASQPQGAAPVACNPMVLSAVDGCIASHLAGEDEVALAQVLGHLRNFSAVEVDAALAELVRNGTIRVEAGVITFGW